jgi:DNA-3-methyladenine glycosylase
MIANTLQREFFQRDPVTCARELIGCTLVWEDCTGIIVETEAYSAVADEACHTWTRPSARSFISAHPPGAAYVYFNYGMYWMLNVLIKGGREDGFVLFRAIEPTSGIPLMTRRRSKSRRVSRVPLAVTALCSGPGKLAQALGVTGRDHGRDFCGGGEVALLRRFGPVKVHDGKRIGISRAKELLWRFVFAGSPHISVRLVPGRK